MRLHQIEDAFEWNVHRLRAVVHLVPQVPQGAVQQQRVKQHFHLIRSNWKQPETSLVIAPKAVGETGTANLAVRDEFEGQSVMVVLLNERGEILDKRSTTVGGD